MTTRDTRDIEPRNHGSKFDKQGEIEVHDREDKEADDSRDSWSDLTN